MSIKQIFYLLLSIIGLIVTWYFNIQWMKTAENKGLIAFFAEGYVNHATTSLTNDLLVVFLCFCVWVVAESKRIGMRFGWIYPPLALFVALAFAYPFFLFLRERHLAAQGPLPYHKEG
jgi:hypothetical protein